MRLYLTKKLLEKKIKNTQLKLKQSINRFKKVSK